MDVAVRVFEVVAEEETVLEAEAFADAELVVVGKVDGVDDGV